MVEIILITPAGRDEVEATPENAVFAARTIWDEALDVNPTSEFRRAMMLIFAVGGRAVRCFEGTRP